MPGLVCYKHVILKDVGLAMEAWKDVLKQLLRGKTCC